MFSDIQDHWAQSSILALKERSRFSGYPDGRFRPQASLTRAEFASLMCGAFPQAEEVRSAIPFRDVPQTHWAFESIQTATKKRFFSGYPDGTFQPEQPLPRVQAIAVLGSALYFQSEAEPMAILNRNFEDARNIPSYARGLVAAATRRGIVVNFPEIRQLNSNQNSTRGEIATLLCRALKIDAVPHQYIVMDVLETGKKRRIFGESPEKIAEYFGHPLQEEVRDENFVIRYPFDRHPGVLFEITFQSNQATAIFYQLTPNFPDFDQMYSDDSQELFQVIFGYKNPINRQIDSSSGCGFYGATVCMGDGIQLNTFEAGVGLIERGFKLDPACEH
ncbi:MAG: S-layer homology domain-containing protein [Limnoraphis sp.]